MNIWLDITNTPQVHFLLAIQRGLERKGYSDFQISARDFSETVNLLNKKTQLPFKVIGSHRGKSMSKKASGLVNRFLKVNNAIQNFDACISCGSEAAIWSSFLKRKKSLAFGDNDLARQWTYGYFVNYAMFPKSIPTKTLAKQGLNKRKLYQYDGFKEHVYVADFVPDQNFTKQLPFENYVVVRPENIQANYVQGESTKSITPRLLKLLSDKGLNILYLPRYSSDHDYAVNLKDIFIPDNAINGLDACFFADGVFTGAGTFAREAACLGVPSFSFFLGDQLLAVDQDLVRQEKMFFSRNPDEIVKRFILSDKKSADLNKARAVNDEVIDKTIGFLTKA